jgi:hypothetical protein
MKMQKGKAIQLQATSRKQEKAIQRGNNVTRHKGIKEKLLVPNE